MDLDWNAAASIGLALGLVVGGVLAWILGRRIDPRNPPTGPSTLARTSMWVGIAAATVMLVGLTDWVVMVSTVPHVDPGDLLLPAIIPALVAYVATTATIVMSLTALARRDRSGAAWTGLAVAVPAFLPFVPSIFLAAIWYAQLAGVQFIF